MNRVSREKDSTKHDYLKLWLDDVLRNQNDESAKNINDKCDKAYSKISHFAIKHVYGQRGQTIFAIFDFIGYYTKRIESKPKITFLITIIDRIVSRAHGNMDIHMYIITKITKVLYKNCKFLTHIPNIFDKITFGLINLGPHASDAQAKDTETCSVFIRYNSQSNERCSGKSRRYSETILTCNMHAPLAIYMSNILEKVSSQEKSEDDSDEIDEEDFSEVFPLFGFI